MMQYKIDWERFTTIEELVEVFGKINLQITFDENWAYFDELLPYCKEVEIPKIMEILENEEEVKTTEE